MSGIDKSHQFNLLWTVHIINTGLGPTRDCIYQSQSLFRCIYIMLASAL